MTNIIPVGIWNFFIWNLLLVACKQPPQYIPNKPVRDVLFNKVRLNDYNNRVYPILLKTIKTGDIITRFGNDLTSTLLASINLHDKSFSHVGIASVEHDTVFIYHALGGELNPSQKLRRETLWSFGHPNDNKKIGVFRFNLTIAETKALQQTAQDLYKKGIPFDMDFNLATDDRLYCAEFVAKALDQVKHDAHFIAISHTPAKDFIGVDDIVLNKAATKLLQLNNEQ